MKNIKKLFRFTIVMVLLILTIYTTEYDTKIEEKEDEGWLSEIEATEVL